MPKQSKNVAAITIIIACIAAVIGIKYYRDASGGAVNSTQAKVKGDKDAPLKITEFIDFQCPACANGSKYLKDVMENHPSLIRLELKYFPLQMHKFGVLSAQYAECAAQQGKFWQMHDLLLARQNNWSRLVDPRPAFELMAKEAKIDVPMLDVCVAGDEALAAIERNRVEGNSRQIRSTPTYFVNGKLVVGQKSLEMEINNRLEE